MVKRFFVQSYLNYKGQQAAFNFEEMLLLHIFYPFATLAFYCIVAAFSFETQDLTRWVVGNSFLLSCSTCIFSLGFAFAGERHYGRIRSIVVSTESKILIILQKGFFPILVSSLTVVIGFFFGCMVFGVDFSGINIFMLALIIVVSIFAATGFGLLLSVFGLLIDDMNLLTNLVSFVLILFSGANFPVEQFPSWIRFLSNLIPLTRGIEATNLLFYAVDYNEIYILLLQEFLIGMGYFLVGCILVKIIEKLAVEKATIDVF